MKKIIASLILVLGILIPAGEANAVFGCSASIGGGTVATNILNTVGAGAVPVSDAIVELNTTTEITKECVLDGLVAVLREAMIATITQNIVDWINSGFDGAPAFVTDLNSFLGEVSDNVALDFIEGTDLGFLCSPFELQVRLSLALSQQPFREQISCSLSDVSGNIEGFLQGDFSQGGWPAWFRLHTGVNNTPYGAYASAAIELSGRQTDAVNEELEKLSWGSGFFSKTRCVGAESVAGDDGTAIDISDRSGCEQSGGSWEIVTPGSQINDQLNEVLSSGLTQLELADEIDEIINALLAQLAQQLFTSVDGLRGLSSSSSSSSRNNSSYLQNLTNETANSSVQSSNNALVQNINTTITAEEAYQDVLDNLISLYEENKAIFEEKHQCLSGAGFLTQANTASTTISVVIDTQLDKYYAELDNSLDTVSYLLELRRDAGNARTPSELNSVSDLYDDILNSGVAHVSADVLFLEQEYAQAEVDLENALARLNVESNGQCFE